MFCVSGSWNPLSSLDFLFLKQEEEFKTFISKPNIPVFIAQKKENFIIFSIVHFLNDTQHYRFIDFPEKSAELLKEPAFILFSREYSADEIKNCTPKGLTLVCKDINNFFLTYEVKSAD
jgi:hypothetical protein